MMLKTPVAFIIFNRPETTQRVFNEIKKVQPQKLFVIADGPRIDKPGETERCGKTREIIDQVNWNCEIVKIYSDENLGCRKRLSTGISEVFSHTEEAIFLEDDCFPSLSFFPFCESLLEYYRNEERIMNIAGINLQFGKYNTGYSYYFSRFVHVWGWASWRRAWNHFDPDLKMWPVVYEKKLFDHYYENRRAKNHWTQCFRETYENKIDTWDHAWSFACWRKGGVTIIPSANLVSNIGFSKEGVHTHDPTSEWANIPVQEIKFPLSHPHKIEINKKADALVQNTHYSPGFFYRAKRKIKKILSR